LRRIDIDVNVNVAPQYRTALCNERRAFNFDACHDIEEKDGITTHVLNTKAF
jgi:hypothetical protein